VRQNFSERLVLVETHGLKGIASRSEIQSEQISFSFQTGAQLQTVILKSSGVPRTHDTAVHFKGPIYFHLDCTQNLFFEALFFLISYE